MGHISAGEMFRRIAKEAELSLEELGHRAESDWHIDRELDARMLELLRKRKQGVFDGRLTGYLAHKHQIRSLKIYLDAHFDVRIQRIMNREKKDRAAVERDIRSRERSERSRYMNIYGVDLTDRSFFDLVMNSSRLLPEDTVDQISRALTTFN